MIEQKGHTLRDAVLRSVGLIPKRSWRDQITTKWYERKTPLMSLDVLKCRIVSPEEATDVYAVNGDSWRNENPALKRIQETGFIPVQEERIGRNCMNWDWHTLLKLTDPSGYDDGPELQKAQEQYYDMLVVFPGEQEKKILPFLDVEEDGAWFAAGALDGEWDFIFISW